jgi:alpha-glucosidase
VTYQVYIRSFADSDGDGLGDVEGIRSRLPYLAELGVDAIWITPWYPSPQADAGYDVADYRSIWPPFGTLEQGGALIREAHAAGLKVLLDIVPNHTSDEHPWFRAALAAGPGSPERDRYVFRDGGGPDGAEPPNDWSSAFRGPAWSRVTEADGRPGQWYLHLFDVKQPDLNWTDPQVREEFESILRFWFDLGVDGFRIDVAHGLAKDPQLPDLKLGEEDQLSPAGRFIENHPYLDRPEVLQIYEGWRRVADGYDPPRVFVAEAWVATPDRLARYLLPGRLNTAFDLALLTTPWRAGDLRAAVQSALAGLGAVGAPVTWVLSNHDTTRQVTRLGRPQVDGANPFSDRRPADLVTGLHRARAAILLMLALPGCAYLYQGEELGLPEVEDLPDDVLQDPTWERSGHTVRGRDGARVPIPWTATGPSFGFGPQPGWLPQPLGWGDLSVESELEDRGSMLWLYRQALHLRRDLPQLGPGGGELIWTGEEADVLGFTRGRGFVCVVNTGSVPIPLPPGDVVLSSIPVEGNLLPGDAAAWIRTGTTP